MDHKLHHPEVVAEFIVIPGHELDNVVIENNASTSIKGERVGMLKSGKQPVPPHIAPNAL